MRRHRSIMSGIVFAVLGMAAWPAFANSTFYAPVSGASFISFENSPYIHYGGLGGMTGVLNNDSQPHLVGASLGYAGGGHNGFWIYFVVAPFSTATVNCTIDITDTTQGTTTGYQYAAYVANNQGNSAQQTFVDWLDTNMVAGNYFYGVQCSIPGNDVVGIVGIVPQH